MTAPGAREQQTIRRRRLRRILLLVSLPVVIAVVFFAAKFIALEGTNQRANGYYAQGAYQSSIEEYSGLIEQGLGERWVPLFNRGVAYAALQQYTDAIDDFEDALEVAPADRECMVRVNLALSWELLGDVYMAGGYYQGGLLLYQNGLAVIDAAGDRCAPPEEGGQQLDDAEQRLLAKIRAAERARDAVEDAQGEDAPDGQQEQLDELGRGEQQGAQEKADGDGAERGREGAGPVPEKPW